ncbi:piggyBac transposable element-derived protein 2-like [Xiphophorus hellerii]|uniref:piggyBac transposable element-derived protein 2-like n=1 Tax=Xiphophorus hellerii TaxID=8084 RepID=UPI0013B416AF|nr:piggyBac transposable element-derived protein 2-like [Xiphophorus hellerii]
MEEAAYDVHQLIVIKEEEKWKSDQEDQKPPQVKEEQEGKKITELIFNPVPVKSEDEEEKPQLPELHHNQTKENRDFVGPEPDQQLESDGEDETSDSSSESSETDVSDGNWEESSEAQMDAKSFYGARPRTLLALVPENPQESDGDLSNDDQVEDPDYQPAQADDTGDSSFESLDEEEAPSKSRSSAQPPRKKSRKGKRTLKTVPLEQPNDNADPSYTPGPNKSTRRIWKQEDIDEFQVLNSKFEPPEAVPSPFQYFKMLFTDEMIEHIAHHTNLYSSQELGDPIKTSPEEIEHFLAILLFMGVFNFPSLEDYWHHESRFDLITDIMPRRRFQLLRRYIHFNDNQQCSESRDRFYKIRPLFEMLREQCLLIPSTHKHSVDEVMVAYKGTRAGTLRQYIANKPVKWGFKLFCRASSSGIIHDLLLYQGASTFFNVALSEEEQALPLGAKVVTTLCKTIKEPQMSVVFCDHFFTSFNLVQYLHTALGVKCIGTVRPNRTGGAPLMTDKDLIKRGRGACDFRAAEGVLAVKWFDNKCVNLLSNACGIMPFATVKRWSKESRAKITIPCPSLISAYNEHMGGIDLSDMLVHLYKTPAKSRRWYFPLFGYILDLCIANSWLLYKRDSSLLNEKPMSLKRFRLAVAHSLNQFNKPASKVGRPSSSSPPPEKTGYIPRPSRPKPQTDVRYDNVGHWPLHCEKRGRCNLCPKGVSRWKCEKCNVFLCLNANQECFKFYHQR